MTMPKRGKKLLLLAMAGAIALVQGSGNLPAAGPGAPVAQTPPFASPDIKPTFGDWLLSRPVALARKVRVTDPLQKPAFAGQPADSLKGMAAGIRATQLDAPNRAKAAAYLGTVDCVTYPQAQKMLISTMKEDPSEEVRYEAVMALRNMLANGCCNMETECDCEGCQCRKEAVRETDRHAKQQQKAILHEAKGPAKKAARKANREDAATRYDCCRGCCNADALNALSEVAYGKDDQCCWTEPSERVRCAAAQGLCLCATVAEAISSDPPVPPVPVTPDDPNNGGGGGEVKPKKTEEVKPGEKSTSLPQLKATTQIAVPPAPVPNAALVGTPSHPVLSQLNGYCIVSLKQRQFLPASPEFSSEFEDRTYFFTSADAKAAFDARPSNFAPAYGGYDPVTWLERHEFVQGQFLREFNGRFYLFSSKENWEAFKQSPERFLLNHRGNSSVVAR